MNGDPGLREVATPPAHNPSAVRFGTAAAKLAGNLLAMIVFGLIIAFIDRRTPQ